MSYANILVSVDFAESTPDRVRLAAALARRFDATLTGAAAAEVPAPLFAHDIRDAQAQHERLKAEVLVDLEQAQAIFARCAGAAPRTAWCGGLDRPSAHLVDKGRAADLIVVGRAGESEIDPGPFGVAIAPVLMEAGRPVLVVPPRVRGEPGRRIVVAWKDSPEARRAVAGALPFLRSADRVFVATAGEGARLEGADEVAAHLALHGASVATHLLSPTVSDGDEILRFAHDHQADLIVMGAYGHSRLREWIFGGATRHILHATNVCCLMAH
ncbi:MULTISPECIES: universal stress protein [Methylobacterium]|uniref:universal stress protein n=1 Tax=Methylobacterium TaxID=407 RepID=UPI0005B9D782|nr:MULTISPECIES: universal stress protein [Methylobacterium]KOX58766.1 universal stress protein UspA [Streptomyces purpurogeneiscleroticus]MDH3027400.1 universal stress protein [Methylobacterium fujisawaense]SFU57859.1 Nucleotide-binding universal stress protein, UspA family [Methylobacterium sp. UNCCL125]